MKTVLVTAIGGDIAQALATILRETRPEWRVIGAEIHDRHGGALHAARVFRAPRADAPEYDGWLERLVTDEQVSLIVPGSEAELIHFAKTGTSAVAGVPLVMPNARAVSTGADKLHTARMLDAAGIPAPRTAEAADAPTDFPLPCIFKTRRGAGSKTVFVCQSREDVDYLRARHPDSILQELLQPADQEVTCGVFRDRHGATAVFPLLRLLTGGFTGWAEVIDDARVIEQCRRVAEAIDLRGSVNLQMRVTEHGPRIFEMNPRFSSTVLMRHRMGFQDFLWSIDDLEGRDIAVPPLVPGTRAVRVQDAAVLPGA